MADLNKEIRRKYRELINEEFPRFRSELNTMHGDKYVAAYLAASKFVIPTISSISLDESGNSSTARDLLAARAKYRNE